MKLFEGLFGGSEKRKAEETKTPERVGDPSIQSVEEIEAMIKKEEEKPEGERDDSRIAFLKRKLDIVSGGN